MQPSSQSEFPGVRNSSTNSRIDLRSCEADAVLGCLGVTCTLFSDHHHLLLGLNSRSSQTILLSTHLSASRDLRIPLERSPPPRPLSSSPSFLELLTTHLFQGVSMTAQSCIPASQHPTLCGTLHTLPIMKMIFLWVTFKITLSQARWLSEWEETKSKFVEHL